MPLGLFVSARKMLGQTDPRVGVSQISVNYQRVFALGVSCDRLGARCASGPLPHVLAASFDRGVYQQNHSHEQAEERE
jgi:hypothetical protein